MKSAKKIFFLTIISLIVFSTGAKAEEVPTKIYAFGFCQSFNDSTVYFSEIQEMDSAWVNSKTKFLYSRNNYSYQLREYMVNVEGIKNPVCGIVYATTLKKATKKYQKLRNKYQNSKHHYLVKDITASYFKFEAIAAADEYIPMTKEERKAERKAEKEARKAQKKAKKNGKAPTGMPPQGGMPPHGGPGGPM